MTPYSIRLVKKVGTIDTPEKRRINEEPTPRLGKIAVIAVGYKDFFEVREKKKK